MNIEELNFLQAVKVYKASIEERPINVHNLHHEQALAGLNYFKTEKNQVNIQSISKQNLSNTENKAITNITGIIKYSLTEQKKLALQRVVELIKRGRFASKGVPKSINDFFTINTKALIKDQGQFIDLLFVEVLDRLDLSLKVDEKKSNKIIETGIINPQIVLTQSFT
jgi:hypothetical protein